MKATVTTRFEGVADGEVYPREFAPGDEIVGDLAIAMCEAGKAEMTLDDDTSTLNPDDPNAGAPETAARGVAPQNGEQKSTPKTKSKAAKKA